MRTALVLRAMPMALTFAVALAVALALSARPAAVPAAERSSPLTVVVEGSGAIRSADGKLSCDARCARHYRTGALVTLVAKPQRGSAFASWTAGCVGTARACTVAVDRATTVRAAFVRLPVVVGITVGGAGVVTSDPPGARCPSGESTYCDKTFGRGETVKLAATPAPGQELAQWGGACAGARTTVCDVTLGGVNRVSATFRAIDPPAGEHVLTVDSVDDQPIVSSPPGIACPGACSAAFPARTLVMLSGAPTGWSGACAGRGPCTLSIDGPTEVSALPPLPMTGPPSFGVNISVSGPGRVEARGGIRCGYRTGFAGDCRRFFAKGSNLVLRAVPDRRARFRGWRSFCIGKQRTCRLRVTTTKSVAAVFSRR